MNDILTHLPHCSKEILEKYRGQFLLSDSELADELLKITDHYVDKLFEYPGQIVNRVQSLMIEINRSLYLNELTGQKLPEFSKVHEMIQGLFNSRLFGQHYFDRTAARNTPADSP